MKSYTELVHRSLKCQPKRSLLTMISIFLAVSLMSAASTLAASIQQTKLNQAVALTGDFHGTFNNLNVDQVNHIRSDGSISIVGTSAPLGSVRHSSINMNIEGFDSTALDLFNLKLLDGRFPQTAGEIVLEAWALERLNPRLSTGDSIQLAYSLYELNNFGLVTQTELVNADFTLVGIIEDIPSAKLTGISLGLVAQETVRLQYGIEDILYTAFVRVSNEAAIRGTIDRLQKSLGIDEDFVSVNESVVSALESGNEARTPILLLGSLIVVASIATIFNIFQISVVERIRQFGMLRSIGATQFQITVLVLGEALLLSLAAIPFGLLFGVGTAFVLAKTLTLLKSVISSLSVPGWAVAASALTGLIATLVSALLPAIYASRISPMAAIRSVDANGKAKALQRKPVRDVGKSGLIGQMAYHNLWRNKMRSLVTIFSLGLGVVLFIVFGAYAASMDAGSVAEQFVRGDYAVYSNDFVGGSGYPEGTAREIENLPGVTKVIKTYEDDMNYSLVPDIESEDKKRQFIKQQAERYGSPEGIAEDGFIPVHSMVFGYDDEILASLSDKVLEGEIDPELMSGGPYAIIVDPDGFFDLHPGDTLSLKKFFLDGEATSVREQTFEIITVISEPPVFLGYGLLGPQIILSDDTYRAYTGISVYKRFDISIDKSAEREFIEGQLSRMAKTIDHGTFISFEEMRAKFEKEKRDILLMVYGLVSIVTLIGVVNIINTLTTSMIVRTREFGTLRAVGMTCAQLKAMTCLEGLYYGLFSSGWGSVIGTTLAYLLLQITGKEGPVGWIGLPWQAILLAAAFYIAVSVLATIAPAKRISRMTIVDSLRVVE